MSHVLGARGQVVIAKEIRDRLGVGPGWSTVQRVVGDRVEIRFVPPEHDRSLAGSLSRWARPDLASEEALREAIEGAWDEGSGGDPGSS